MASSCRVCRLLEQCVQYNTQPLSSSREGEACDARSMLTGVVIKGCGLCAYRSQGLRADNMAPPLYKSLSYPVVCVNDL